MQYLYHMVPENMAGSTLFPLNELKISFPDIYRDGVAMYQGRESLCEFKLPILDCLWNDVLHLTAINPEDIASALKDAGHNVRDNWRFFRINPKVLNESKMVVYLFKTPVKNYQIPPDEIVNVDYNELPKYSQLPQKAKDYYQQCIYEHQKPFLFMYVPHILYKGTIDTQTNSVDIVTV